MPIKKGSTTIGAIYKGTTQIAKVYKGTKLLFENAVWLDYYFKNLYHDLVPETISSKSVKNKAKVSVIEGNGVVENQLLYEDSIVDRGITSSISNGKWYASGLSSSSFFKFAYAGSFTEIVGHKYFFACNIVKNTGNKTVKVGFFNDSMTSNAISGIGLTYGFKTATQTATGIGLQGYTSGDQLDLEFYAWLVDLTLMFGTGNEPTTTSDNRIQSILNRGYIPYNTGTYKGTDIGLFSSEPYNLFDGILTDGYLENNGNITAEANGPKTSTNYIKVMPNTTYTWEVDKTTNERYICEYDEHKIAIKLTYVGSPYQITTQANTRYVRVEFKTSPYTTDVNACFHRTGTRTGYAPHKTFTPIAFKYQGNGAIDAHDTMTVTKDNVVFEKNIGSYTFTGSETFVDWAGSGKSLTIEISSAKSVSSNNDIGNIVWGLNATTFTNNINSSQPEYSISMNTTHRLYIATTKTSAQLASALTGQPLYFELATPQTITIPRKHLGVLKLSDYITSVSTANSSGVIQIGVTNAGVKTNTSYINVPDYIYCSKYLNDTYSNVYGGTKKNTIGFVNNTIGIQDDNLIGLTYTQVKEYFIANDVLVFYETENEVADILDTLDIETGGTVNANWFEWVENQIVYDGNFANGTNDWFCLSTVYSQSVTNNVMTVTKNAGGAGAMCSKANSDITYTAGHKFVALAQIKPSRACTMNFMVSTTQTGQSMTANVWNTLSYFANPSSLTNLYFAIYETTNTLQVNDTVDIKNVMLIDLTQAFGAGNEPTSVNDPRIQYILNKGYIPTNTTGTYKLVDCEVLPNVEFKMKCK